MAHSADVSTQAARAVFPRGLHQPEGRFRFSLDALVLAAFARPPAATGNVLDLGAGCGVVGLGLLLRNNRLAVTALDRDPSMAAAARDNAELLGFADSLQTLELEAACLRSSGRLAPESQDLVVMNPPFRQPGRGRTCRNQDRNQALFEEPDTLPAFLDAARFAVKNRSPVVLVFAAERLDALLAACRDHGLVPKRLVCVHSHVHRQARQVLVETVKNGGPGLAVEPPLVLYDAEGRHTGEALAFCPWLASSPD